MDFKKLVEEYLIEKPFWNMILEESYLIGKSKNNKPDANGTEESYWEGFDLVASCHHFNYGRIGPEFNNLLSENHITIQWKPYLPGISLDYCDDTWFISEKLKHPISLNSKSTTNLQVNPVIEAAQKLGAVYIPSKINNFVPYLLCDYEMNHKYMYMAIVQNAQLIQENLSKSEEYQNLRKIYKNRLETKTIINVLLWIMLLFNVTFIVYYSMV
tara:strand:+ start:194 stop:835 length:642 start_codon:yes stop_codon:yes gene_type:complete